MCRAKRVSGGRISKVGPRRAPVCAATLVPVRVMAGERVVANAGALASGSGEERKERADIPRDVITVGNVATCVSSLSLLRVWAHNSRATCERMWRHHVGEGAKKFVFDVGAVEGDGTALERERKLHYFAEVNVRNEAEVWRKVQGSFAAWRCGLRPIVAEARRSACGICATTPW